MPDITKGKIFTSGETVTASEMNSLVDDAVINNNAITESKIAAGAVTNAKIASSAGIGLNKLASGIDGQIPICSGTGVPTYVTLTGATVTNAGVVSLDADSVDSAQYVDGSIDTAHLADLAPSPAGSFTNSSVTINAAGQVTAASSGSDEGKVLQVVYADVTAATFSQATTTTMADITGLNATITPTSATSTILVQVMISLSTHGNNHAGVGLKRDTTQIGQSTGGTGNQQNSITGVSGEGTNRLSSVLVQYRDSPASVSAATYQATVSGRDYTFALNKTVDDGDNDYEFNGISTITLTEIAG